MIAHSHHANAELDDVSSIDAGFGCAALSSDCVVVASEGVVDDATVVDELLLLLLLLVSFDVDD
jgi:hypothetical protein